MSTTGYHDAPLARPAVGAGRELILTRILPAPRDRVFRAWTRQLPQWWGPHGMTMLFCEIDLRPGGVFRLVLQAPNGTEYPSRGVFLEVVENERIVFTDAFDSDWQPNPAAFLTAVISFETVAGGRTRYTARALHWKAEHCAQHQRMGFNQGWGESLDRLMTLVSRS